MANKADDEVRWSEWMSLAQKGDKASYSRLLGEIFPYIRNFLYKGIADKSAIEDITQEVLISVHHSMKTYDKGRAFKPWLHAIITYRRIDYLRKHYNKKTTSVEDIDFTAFDNDFVTTTAHIGELKDIEAALATLPKKQRQLIEMMKIEGYTAKEVADKTGMTETAVKVSVHRSLGKLKDYLG